MEEAVVPDEEEKKEARLVLVIPEGEAETVKDRVDFLDECEGNDSSVCGGTLNCGLF